MHLLEALKYLRYVVWKVLMIVNGSGAGMGIFGILCCTKRAGMLKHTQTIVLLGENPRRAVAKGATGLLIN